MHSIGGAADLSSFSIVDGEDLLSYHREHLNIDTVELIKAAPRPRLS